MHPDIESRMAEITAACRKHRAARLEIFGSAARGADFDPATSDADFLVEFLPPVFPGISDRYFGLIDDLESVLGRRVDLITERRIANPYFREAVNQSRELVYEP